MRYRAVIGGKLKQQPTAPIEAEPPSSAIVTNKSQKALKLLRQEHRAQERAAKPDDPKEVARVKAFIKRMTRPPER